MEINLLREIAERVENGENVAVATITGCDGSVPGRVGSMLLILENGTTKGTIGGGKAEYEIIQRSLEALNKGDNFEFSFNMTEEEGFACGGTLKGFVKIYKPKKKLVIFGGGHVSRKISKLAEIFDFDVYVIDNRAEYKALSEFSMIKEFHAVDIKEGIKRIRFDRNTYIVVATRSHELDEEVVSSIAHFQVAYIGMLGSERKVLGVAEKLREKGFTDKVISSLYAPIGLKIDDGTPEELALSILSEIVMVKNGIKL